MIVEFQIMKIMNELERNYDRIYAWHIQARLDVTLCEQTIRRKMCEMSERGKLERLGERKGYRLRRV